MSENKDIEEETGLKTTMGKDWGESLKSGRKRLFKSTEDFDIYCDCENERTYIFHGPELNCTVTRLEYDPDIQRVTVFTNDGQQLDLGTRIQWLIRPYFAKAQNIFIIRTKDGQAIDGLEVPMTIKPIGGEKTVD